MSEHDASMTEDGDSQLEVVILAGGLSHEREVSLRSGRRIAKMLRAVDMNVTVRDVDGELLPALSAQPPDVVFPLVHGSTGEDGSLRSLVGLLDLPYVGSRPAACRLASQKPVAKSIVDRVGVATPEFMTLPRSLFNEIGATGVLTAAVQGMGMPLMVKPVAGGSALGVSMVASESELPEAMVACFAYGDVALIERAVSGTELAVSVIDLGDGPRALPPVEIVTDGPYDYDARYNPGRAEFFVPARLSDDVVEQAKQTAIVAHDALGLRDLSRTDLIVDDDGVAWFIDVNVAPGMTETSLFPQAAQAHGTAGGPAARELYSRLVTAAAARGAA